jgi:ankyrin repeat protein
MRSSPARANEAEAALAPKVLALSFGLLACAAVVGVSLREAAAARLAAAVEAGRVEEALRLIDAGAPPNARTRSGVPVLAWAANESENRVVAALLAHGADPALRDPKAYTALTLAARSGNLVGAQMLLDAGADVNDRASWHPALLVASRECDFEMVSLLLGRGADPAMSRDGRTALDRAVDGGCPRVANLLRRAAQVPGPASARGQGHVASSEP